MSLQIGLVRHGHSAAQDARETAERAGRLRFTFDPSDEAAPLSERGREEAERLGKWLRRQGMTPSAVFASPFCRARETAERASSGICDITLDDRLVEIGWGQFDGLTRAGRRTFFPGDVERIRSDKFHHGPPGGESWSHVAARVRPVVERVLPIEGLVLIVCHEVTVKCLRHVLESLSPQQTLELCDVPNASLTLYRCAGGSAKLELENFVPAEPLTVVRSGDAH